MGKVLVVVELRNGEEFKKLVNFNKFYDRIDYFINSGVKFATEEAIKSFFTQDVSPKEIRRAWYYAF